MKTLPQTTADLLPGPNGKQPGFWVCREDMETLFEYGKHSLRYLNPKKAKALGVYVAICELASENGSPTLRVQSRRIRNILAKSYDMSDGEIADALKALHALGIIQLGEHTYSGWPVTLHRFRPVEQQNEKEVL